MSTLFPLPKTPSPRLRWMQRHGLIVTRYNPGGKYYCLSDSTELNWVVGDGDTEDEAVTNWARKAMVKLWNEEKL